MNRSHKVEGFVLKKRNLINRDIIITLFSKDYGKISIFAKGAKKITSRRSPHIQTGNLIRSVLTQRNNYYYLQETSLISAFSRIKEDQTKIRLMYFVFFILERLLPENQSEEDVYELFKRFLIELSGKNEFSGKRITIYVNAFLKKLGFINEDKHLSELKVIIEDIIHEKMPSFFV